MSPPVVEAESTIVVAQPPVRVRNVDGTVTTMATVILNA